LQIRRPGVKWKKFREITKQTAIKLKCQRQKEDYGAWLVGGEKGIGAGTGNRNQSGDNCQHGGRRKEQKRKGKK